MKINCKNKKCIVISAIVILLLVWGLIGGSQAEKLGVTCDIGINDGHTFCWIWHENAFGEIQNAFDDIAESLKG